MSKIRSKNTKPELILKNLLKGKYLRYQPKGILGNPDFASKQYKLAIFIDGDFWHGYNWKKLGKVPPKDFWQEKITKNIRRDTKYNKALKKNGWVVLRIWEHQILNNPHTFTLKIDNLIYKLRNL